MAGGQYNFLVWELKKKPTKNVKGLISELHVFLDIDGGHSELSLGHVPVVLHVVGQAGKTRVSRQEIITWFPSTYRHLVWTILSSR